MKMMVWMKMNIMNYLKMSNKEFLKKLKVKNKI